MRHRKSKSTLDRNASQRQRLRRSLAISLVMNEKIITTKARGRVLKSYVERLITIGRKNNEVVYRRLHGVLGQAAAAKKIIHVLAPRYQPVKGGYLRATKLPARHGDQSEMVFIEFVKAQP